MQLKKALQIAIQVLDKAPNQRLYSEAKTTLEKCEGWCYPRIDGKSFEHVVHCSNCEHYRKYRKKGSPKKDFRMLCSIDKTPRRPDFYCGDAKERDQNE